MADAAERPQAQDGVPGVVLSCLSSKPTASVHVYSIEMILLLRNEPSMMLR